MADPYKNCGDKVDEWAEEALSLLEEGRRIYYDRLKKPTSDPAQYIAALAGIKEAQELAMGYIGQIREEIRVNRLRGRYKKK